MYAIDREHTVNLEHDVGDRGQRVQRCEDERRNGVAGSGCFTEPVGADVPSANEKTAHQ